MNGLDRKMLAATGSDSGAAEQRPSPLAELAERVEPLLAVNDPERDTRIPTDDRIWLGTVEIKGGAGVTAQQAVNVELLLGRAPLRTTLKLLWRSKLRTSPHTQQVANVPVGTDLVIHGVAQTSRG